MQNFMTKQSSRDPDRTTPRNGGARYRVSVKAGGLQ